MEVSSKGASLQALRTAIQDIFNIYLGGPRGKNEDSAKDLLTSNVRKRITAAIRSQAPKEDQFAADILQLQNHFPDPEQFRAVIEPILASLLVNCSSHMIQSEFLLFALQTVLRMNLVNWDSFVPLLLRAASAAEPPGAQSGHMEFATSVSAGPTGAATQPSNTTVSAPPMPQVSTPVAPSPSSTLIGSPNYSVVDPSVNQSPVKGPELSSSAHTPVVKGSSFSQGYKVISWLRQLVCKVMLMACAADLKPVTCLDILCQVVQWIHTWDSMDQNGSDEQELAKLKRQKWDSNAWLYSCLEIVRVLVDENKCRLPFYVLLHGRSQLHVEHWPNDEVLFALFLEIHRRRDKISLYMQMLDQHLQCPTFATQRMLALTYPGLMGEPVHGEDAAIAVQRGSLDWERAIRCLRHGLRVVPSSEWWRRVLIFAPRYRQPSQQQSSAARQGYFILSMPGLVFTAEMTCEAVIDRITELMQPLSPASGNSSTSASLGDTIHWQEWLTFADLFFFFVRNGYLDFLEFIDALASRFANGEQQMVRSNHVTWLLAQVLRLETVTTSLSTDPKKVETTLKIFSFLKEERPVDQNGNMTPQSILLDFVGSSQISRLWSIQRPLVERLRPEHVQKGKQIEEWWKQVGKGERVLDYSNLDDMSMGMVWVVSHTISQPVCEAIMTWMKSNGMSELILSGNVGQPGERLAVIHETRLLPIALLSGLSLHVCIRLISQIEELIFSGQMLPSIAMVETYVRLLLVAPQTLFGHHLNGMMQRYQTVLGKSGISFLLLELLNYRLIPLYRYHGKVKQFLYDIAKIIITMKVKRGEHRLFRLAENICINLVMSLREVMLVKKELKGATTEFSETLNRVMLVNLAITIKTRGIAEFEQLLLLQPAIDQILANSQHSWSDKTMRYFPPLLRDALASRPDKRSQTIQGWQQVEATVINQCRQLLSPSADPAYALTYVNHSYRHYLCAGAWMLMDGLPDSINTVNLGRILKELSPEDVTINIYTMVDVLLYNIQLQLKHGHQLQELLLRASAGLALLMWSQELLPFDIVLLALADRDDDTHALRLVVGLLLDRPEFQQRVKNYCMNRGQQEHWLNPDPLQRPETQQALGVHLTGKDRFPVFFDEMSVRALPVIPLIIYRLIENDATETADKLLAAYSTLLVYHPARFTLVRDTLAYFYGHLPNKLVMRFLTSLDLNKIPFSEAFLQHLVSSNSGQLFVSDYFANLLLNLVNSVIPTLGNTRRWSYAGDGLGGSSRGGGSKGSAAVSTVTLKVPESANVFYQHQDPGTCAQLTLETAVIELLSLPHLPNQIVSTLVQIAVRVQPSQTQSNPLLHGHLHGHSMASQGGTAGHLQNLSAGNPRSPLLPTSPTATTVDSLGSNLNSGSSLSGSSNMGGLNSILPPLVSSPLMIQACGLLLAQLPQPFHLAMYAETARIFKDCWWMTDVKKLHLDLDAAYGYSAWDPTWAAQDDTSTIIGNTVALLHAFASNLPFEWLEGMHAVINLQRPIASIAQLRLSFRTIGPLLPRLVISRPLFAKTLALLFTILADVFGRNSQIPSINASEISDLIDFLHHAVMFEVQGQTSGKPRHETLTLCSKAVDRLHPDLQPLFRHLTIDPNSSIYAATNPKLVQRPPSPLMGIM